MVSYELISNKSEWSMGVLILVVVDKGLVHDERKDLKCVSRSLNPYCSGRWSRTVILTVLM